MGVLITADKAPATSAYTNWICYRSATKTGVYSAINGATGQLLTDLTYFDEDGSSTSWYKISYYNTSTDAESGLSDPIQGQSTIYTSVRKVESLLQMATGSDSTNPSVQEIVQIINRKEDEIDNATGQAWRVRFSGTESGQDTTQRYEFKDMQGFYEYNTGIPIYLDYRKVRDLDADEGDALEFWNGNAWEDWLATKTEGRGNDWWADYKMGVIYVRGYVYSRKNMAFRIKYRYGDTFVNRDIEDIATKMAAIDLLAGMDPRAFMVQEGPSPVMSHSKRIEIWQEEIDRKLARYKEFKVPSSVY